MISITNDSISVIVPIYNQELYLKRCIDSILKQSFQNLDIILVDDGSTDSSLQICKSIKDERVRVYHQTNSGVSVARNMGMKHAKGKWLSFVDPDDYLDSDYFKTLISEIKKEDEVDIVSCCAIADIGGKEQEINTFFEKDFVAKSFDSKKPLFLELMDSEYGHKKDDFRITAIGVPWGKLYRKKMIFDNNIQFDPRLRRMQDNIFNMFAFYYAQKIKYINKPLYFYSTDSINNYIHGNYKYLPYYIQNAEVFMEYRYEFMQKLSLFGDREFQLAYENEALAMINSVLNWNLLNPKNKLIDKQKKRMMLKLFYKKEFAVAQKLKLNDVNGKSTKVVYLALKYHKPSILLYAWKVKLLVYKLL